MPESDKQEDLAPDSKDRVRWWLSALIEAQNEADQKGWPDQVRSAWREFQGQKLADGFWRKGRSWHAASYQRYWSDTMVMLPALYQEPRPVARRRFDNDLDSRTASIIMERFGTYLMETSCYNQAMQSGVLEYLHASRATARVWFEGEVVTRPKRVIVTESISYDEMGMEVQSFVDESGEPIPEDVVVLNDPDGSKYYELEDTEEEVENPAIYVSALHFDEMRFSVGARRRKDVWWEAYLIRTTRQQARERFGAIVDEIESARENVERDNLDAVEHSEAYDRNSFEYWEIWDKKAKKVCWVAPHWSESFLDEQDDPYELEGFFPTPEPMMVNVHYNDLFPTPDYTETRDLYENLHLYMLRINTILKSIKCSALIDGSRPELQSLLEEIGDGQWIGIKNLKDLLGNGGLEDLILIPDYSRHSQVLNTLIQGFQQDQERLDQIRGIAEIIRSTSVPEPTATGARLKRAAATNRFSLREKEVMRFARDLLEKMLDLGFKTFPEENIRQIVGFSYMDPEDQERFDRAMLICRDDKSRMVRIDLETDQTSALREEDRKQEAVDLLQAVNSFMVPAMNMVQQTPFLAPLMFKVLEMTMSSFPTGKHAQDELTETFKALNEQVKAMSAPQEPPGPDIEQQKLQQRQQESQMNAQIEQMKIQMQSMQDRFDAQIRQQELALKQREQTFFEQLSTAKLNIEAQESDAVLREKFMEEQRLAEKQLGPMAQEAAMRESQPPSPSVVINLPQPLPQPQVPDLIMEPTFLG